MTIDYDDFTARFPEFVEPDEALIEALIARAALQLPASSWGTLLDEGLLYLTAHIYSRGLLAGKGGPSVSGAVAGRSVGDVSVTFAGATASGQWESYYGSTSYGQEFMQLAMSAGMWIGVVQ